MELRRRWDEAAEAGALRTSANDAQWRVAPGELGVIVTFNPLHRANKRPVAAELAGAAQSDPPVASTAFNFTKARPIEFLCGFRATPSVPAELAIEDLDDQRDSSDWEPPHHAVLVNVSPLMRGHLLCVFDLNALHPQSLTFDMLRLAAGVGPLVARADFALGFNSAGAWSSVNHCHFQGYWMGDVSVPAGLGSRDQFPVVLQPRDVLFCAAVDESQVAVSRLVHWPMRCLVIEQFESNVDGSTPTTDSGVVLRVTWQLIHILQTQGIPHNLLFVWRPRLQVIVFPRQPQQENAMGRFSVNDSGQQLRFAVAEVSGLVVTGGPSMFSELTESIYADIMRHELSLDELSFSALVETFCGAL